jgi:hypothetical protein
MSACEVHKAEAEAEARKLSRVSFMFGGGFYAWPYHAGVGSYLEDHRLINDDSRLYAVSSGIVPAVLLATGVHIEREGFFHTMRANDQHLKSRFGPYFSPRRIVESFEQFARILPADAHERASGRLHVVVTELPTLQKRVLSQFKTRDALLDALKASMAIPGHGVPIAYRAHHFDRRLFIDGGFTANIIDDNRPGYRTIRIGVFDFHSVLKPVPRGLHIRPSEHLPWRMRLWVESDDVRRAWHRRGYDDARRYFERDGFTRHP